MAQGQSFPIFITARSDPDQRAFDEFVTKAADAGRRASSALTQSMAGVKDTIAQALSIPRNSSGSLDLQISQLREMEQQADAVARATLQYANAQKQAAITSGQTSRARNEEIRAGFELARVEAQNVAQLRARIAILDQVQAELNQTAAATDKVISATRRGTDAYGIHNASLRGSRVAMIQTGQQLQDMAIQFQMGTRASTVFSQQIPQLLFALTSLEGSANKTASKIGSFATLLSGPWSIAVVAGAALFGGLIDKFLLSGDAADKSGSAISNLSNKLDLTKNSYESLIAVVEEYNKAQSSANAVTYEAIEAAQKQAQANLTAAKSEAARLAAEVARGPTGPNGQGQFGASIALNVVDSRIEKLTKDLADADVAFAAEKAKLATDERYAIGVAYDRELVKWQEKRKQNLIDEATLTRVNIALEEKKKKALEDYDAAHRKSSEYSGSRDLADFGAPVTGGRISSGYGTRIAPTKGASTNHLGIDYAVPVGTPVYATQSGIIKFAGTAGGYGNQIQLSHGGGTESRYSHLSSFAVGSGASVNKGDLIGYSGKTGTVTGPDLHYEVLVNGKKVDPSKGKFPIDAGAVAKEAKQAADALQDFGARSAEKIQRINEAFDEQPRLIDRANQATRELDATIAELNAKQPEGFKQMVADAEKAKGTIQDSLVRPFRELREESEKRLTVETLLTQGREDEARALQEIWRLESQLGPLSEQRKAEVLATVRHEREVNEELRVRQEIIGQYLDATRSVRQELVSIFSGEGSLSNLNKIFKNLQANVLVEKLFGGALRDFDKWIKGQSGLGDSIDYFASETDRGAGAVKTFADVVLGQADRVRSGIAGGSLQSQFDAAFPAGGSTGFFGATGSVLTGWLQAVNDNTTELVVTGKRLSGVSKSIDTNLSPDEWARKLSRTLGDGFADALGISSPTGRNVLSGALYGQTLGGRTGGIIGALSGLPGVGSFFGQALGGLETANIVGSLSQSLGLGLNGGGTQIGSMIGSVIPGIGPLIGSIVGGVAGSGNIRRGLTTGGGALAGFAVGGPVGAAIGALLGNVIGGLFGKRPRGAAEVSNSSVNAHTNDSALTSSTNDWGSTVQQAVSRIADALGVNVGNYSIGLGRYKDYYQVSSVAGDPRLGNSYFGRDSRNAVYDGLDAEAATRAAVVAAIQNGAVAGISQASLNILKAGKDLDAALKKAVLIESIPKRLKQLTDPVGAAIDELNKQFEEMIAALKEGGASAQQFADAQKLYELERARTVQQAIDSVTGSLKSLLDSLTIGNDALSLRDRKAAALAAYTPLAARVAAGDTSAYADFADAARALLDIERQISGSQTGYFDLLNEVTALTRTQLDSQQALIDAANSGNNPFTADPATTPANDNSAALLAVNNDQFAMLTNINSNLITLGQQLGNVLTGGVGGSGGGGGGFGMNSNVANF